MVSMKTVWASRREARLIGLRGSVSPFPARSIQRMAVEAATPNRSAHFRAESPLPMPSKPVPVNHCSVHGPSKSPSMTGTVNQKRAELSPAQRFITRWTCSRSSPMTKRPIEIITSVERRRRWSREEKERLVAACLEPGAVLSEIARAAGIHVSQLFRWRKELCEIADALRHHKAAQHPQPEHQAEGFPRQFAPSGHWTIADSHDEAPQLRIAQQIPHHSSRQISSSCRKPSRRNLNVQEYPASMGWRRRRRSNWRLRRRTP